jgi:hypothetical protein
MPRKKRQTKRATLPDTAPTVFAMQHGDFTRPTLAYRRTPAIETLHHSLDGNGKPKLSERQYRALAHYRDRAIQAERSPIRDSCDMTPRGNGGDGPGAAVLRARSDVIWLERELGMLAPIARAVAVDDVSLTEWAIAKAGGVERPGRAPAAKPRALSNALMDIRMAGERLAAAIEA